MYLSDLQLHFLCLTIYTHRSLVHTSLGTLATTHVENSFSGLLDESHAQLLLQLRVQHLEQGMGKSLASLGVPLLHQQAVFILGGEEGGG